MSEKEATLVQAIITMKRLLNKIPDEEIVKAIRETRDQR